MAQIWRATVRASAVGMRSRDLLRLPQLISSPSSSSSSSTNFCKVTAAVTTTLLTIMMRPQSQKFAMNDEPQTHKQAKAHTQVSLLTPAQILDVTAIVVEQVSVPLVPASIQEYVVADAVTIVSAELPKRLNKDQLARISRAVDKGSGGMTVAQKDSVIDSLCNSLDQVPLIPKSSRKQIISKIFDVIIGDETIGESLGSSVSIAVKESTNLLDPDSRKRLAGRLSKDVIIPGVTVEQEKKVFELAINCVAAPIEAILPKAWRTALQGSSSKEIEDFKENVTCALESQLHLPHVTAEIRHKILRSIVGFTFDTVLATTGAGNVVLDGKARLVKLEEARNALLLERDCFHRKTHRQELGFTRRLAHIDKQKVQLEKELGMKKKSSALMVAFAALAAGGLGGAVWFASRSTNDDPLDPLENN